MSMVARKNVIIGLGNAIRTSIGSSVSDRVYYTPEAPQDKELPLCLYFGTGDVPQYDYGKESLDANYQISIFDDKEKGALSITNLGDTLLNDLSRQTLSITGYVNVDVQIIEAGRIAVEGDYLHLILEIRILGFPS